MDISTERSNGNSSSPYEPQLKKIKFEDNSTNKITSTINHTKEPLIVDEGDLFQHFISHTRKLSSSDSGIRFNINSSSTVEENNVVVTTGKASSNSSNSINNEQSEIAKKDILIKELLSKLQECMNTINTQSTKIKDLQSKLGITEQDIGELTPIAENTNLTANVLLNIPRQLPVGDLDQFKFVELKILQQPPSQAIYQRILRPFPTIAITGVNSIKSQAFKSLFVEVNLLKQVQSYDGYSEVTPTLKYAKVQGSNWQSSRQGSNNSNIASALTGANVINSNNNNSGSNGNNNNNNSLMGGQLVVRSELNMAHDNQLLVVFRKLKILTTTLQQGGAFFVLKFILKYYVDNVFQTVPNVNPVISDPIEVFSHTLYLSRERPNGKHKLTTSTGGTHFNLNSSKQSKTSSGSGNESDPGNNSSSSPPLVSSEAIHENSKQENLSSVSSK